LCETVVKDTDEKCPKCDTLIQAEGDIIEEDPDEVQPAEPEEAEIEEQEQTAEDPDETPAEPSTPEEPLDEPEEEPADGEPLEPEEPIIQDEGIEEEPVPVEEVPTEPEAVEAPPADDELPEPGSIEEAPEAEVPEDADEPEIPEAEVVADPEEPGAPEVLEASDDVETEDQEEVEGEPEDKTVQIDDELINLVKLPGVGPMMAKILFEAGYTDLRKLKRATVVELMKIQGIGRKAAGEIKSALRETDLTELRQQELTEDQVGTEYQCPLCLTIVSAFETSCYECGTAFNTDPVDMGDSDRLALSYYDSKLLRTPDNPELWYARGATLMKMEDFNLALNSFDRALEIDPDFGTAWVSKAEVYNKLGDPIKAAECYGHVITRSSGSFDGGEGSEDVGLQVTAEDIQDFEAELEGEPEPSKGAPPPITEMGGEPVGALVEEALDREPSPEVASAVTEPPLDEPEVTEPAQPDMGVSMDYDKPDVTVELEGKSEKELKHYLSQRATYVKPLLILAKETEMDISMAKRHIAKGVAESKKGGMIDAIKLVNQGIDGIEFDFRVKLNEDVSFLADKLRELKVSGMDVSRAVDLITSAKEDIETNEFKNAFDKMTQCLEMVEKVSSS